MIFLTISATSLTCCITSLNFFHIFLERLEIAVKTFRHRLACHISCASCSSLPLVRLRQDLAPIKNTCQVKEEAIEFSKLNHAREVTVRPVYTMQAEKLESLR